MPRKCVPRLVILPRIHYFNEAGAGDAPEMIYAYVCVTERGELQ